MYVVLGGLAMSGPVAVLDANVLFPASLRDTLLRAAEKKWYEVHWSADIIEEMRRNLLGLGQATEPQVTKLLNSLNRAFPAATVIAYQRLIAQMTNDPKDRHVLAAAVTIQANVIVTFNLRDFPASALQPYHIVAQHPDQFLLDLFQQYEEDMARMLIEQAAFLRKPSQSLGEVLTVLGVLVPRFVQAIREYLAAHPELMVPPALQP